MIRFHSPKDNAAYIKFLVLNVFGAVLTQVLVSIFYESSLLSLAVAPIILSGWLFGQRFTWFSALFILGCNGVYFHIQNLDQYDNPKGLAFGIITFAIFASMGFALRFVRDLYTRIYQLNEVINRKNLELQDAVFKDPLTDLRNRRYVNEIITEQVTVFLQQLTTPEFALRNRNIENKVLFVMIADIDNFKKINDSHGHMIGDEVLSQVSRRIRDAVRFDDTVVRWGGEEFLIICPLMNRDAAELVMKKVLDNVMNSSIKVSNNTIFNVTISIGAIWMPFVRQSPHLVSLEKSIMIADQALYDVKSNGRCHGRLVVFRDDRSISEDLMVPEISEELYRNPEYCNIRVVGK